MSYKICAVKVRNAKLRNYPKNREAIMIFKALTRQAPDYLRELFTECKNDFYCIRSNDTKLALPKPRTNFQKEVFRFEQQSRGTNYRVT